MAATKDDLACEQDCTGSCALALASKRKEFLEECGIPHMLKTTEITDDAIKPPNLGPPALEFAQELVPVVDVKAPREDVLSQIRSACEWGFFHVVNYETPSFLLANMARESEEFFALPVNEKQRCSTSAKVAGPVHFGLGGGGDCREVLKLQCSPPSSVALANWPSQPLGFRETIMTYSRKQVALAMWLLEMIGESLGLKKGYIEEVCQEPRVVLAINHYPPCADPGPTIGIREHSDPNTLTVLQQDQVGGLQVYKGQSWIDVKPLTNALVVNVGDHLQILSNGRYRSCLHRVLNNKSRSRTSIAMFVSPSLCSHVRPAPELVDDEHPPVYQNFLYADFLRKFYEDGGPNKKVNLGRFQNEAPVPDEVAGTCRQIV